MRWLNGRGRRERGAVAVVVALCMVVLMGFTALAIDVGSIVSDRQQLQNGADAGALAIAESCQRGSCIDTADKYAKANKLDGQATGTAVINQTAGSVTVEATSTHQNWFAGVLGKDLSTTAIGAKAEATWGAPLSGETLPLTFSWCDFFWATGGWDAKGTPKLDTTVVITDVNLKEKLCTPPAHNEVSGGFGWLKSTNCLATIIVGKTVGSDPGMDGSGSCKNFDWTSIQGKTVLVPIFQVYSDQGNNATYTIIGVAAFTITGYCFSQQDQWGNLKKCPSNRQIQGHFIYYKDLTANFSVGPGATDFGTSVAKLTG